MSVQNVYELMNEENDVIGESETLVEESNLCLNEMTERDNNAVEVNDLWFKYRNNADKDYALQSIHMSVAHNSIYGLLGPSGCGKTTLLRCIVGRLKPNSGFVRVFGTIPGTSHASVPGPGVGYMPQELALYQRFTIKEILAYFATLNGVQRHQIKARIDFLTTFLQLPQSNHKLISHLSGGQKRRVSLAAALVHNPPLLVLDEPTIGVDPLLRERIWDHLLCLTQSERMTIIITTHYVEEAKRAHKIGFMRENCLLLEEKPNRVLNQFNVNNLEEAFLRLSQIQDNDNENRENREEFQNGGKSANKKQLIDHKTNEIKNLQIKQMIALFNKNFIFLKRNITALIFALILPAIQITLFCTCIGNAPNTIQIGVYRYIDRFNDSQSEITMSTKLINDYIDKIGSRAPLIATFYESAEEAIESVRSGTNWAALVFGDYFAESLEERFNAKPFYNIDDEVIEESTVTLYADMTNFLVMDSLLKELTQITNTFASEALTIVPGANNNAIKPILALHEPPIYGTRDPNFKTYTASGVILTLAFMMALLLTTLVLVNERKEGQLERCLICGVKSHLIFIAYISVQLCVAFIQVILLLMTAYIVFKIPIEGSYALIIALTLLQGVCGTCAGFLISCVCEEEQTAFILAFGSFFASLLLSGVFWPLESMPNLLRYFSNCLPQTLAVESFRAITLRGWPFTAFDVWIGFFSTCVWILIYVFATIFTISYKS